MLKQKKFPFFWPLSICLGVNFPVNSAPWAPECPELSTCLRDPQGLPAEHAYARAHAQPAACGSPPVPSSVSPLCRLGHHVTHPSCPHSCTQFPTWGLAGGSWKRPRKTSAPESGERLSVSQSRSRKLPCVKNLSRSNTSPVVTSDLYKTKSRVTLLRIARWHLQSIELLKEQPSWEQACSQLSWPTYCLWWWLSPHELHRN